jgi:hypothetical protein
LIKKRPKEAFFIFKAIFVIAAAAAAVLAWRLLPDLNILDRLFGNYPTAWRLPGDCLATAWRLPGDCLATAWRLPGDCLVADRLPSDCLTTTNDCMTSESFMMTNMPDSLITA